MTFATTVEEFKDEFLTSLRMSSSGRNNSRSAGCEWYGAAQQQQDYAHKTQELKKSWLFHAAAFGFEKL
jgi:hypothetical protein